MKKVVGIIGGNFGDEGKGLATDYLVSHCDFKSKKLVVLTNGGSQRAHTVTVNGFRHVFRHLGSVVFNQADTYIPASFIVNPVIFRQEYNELLKLFGGLVGDIYVNSNCMFTTIFDMLINQVREIDRGTAKHGSCGLGIFETICRYQRTGMVKIKEEVAPPFAVTIGEFSRMTWLEKYNFLETLRNYYVEKRINIVKIANFDPFFEKVLKTGQVIKNFIDDFEFFDKHVIYITDEPTFMQDWDDVFFENGQGLLLDQNNTEYFPHLTPSNTGLKGIADILENCGYTGAVDLYYVSRTYMTRHGAGRFDSECPKDQISRCMKLDETNVPNPFQDTLRYGKLTLDPLVDRIIGDIESQEGRSLIVTPHIFLTHCDELDFTNLYRNNFMVDISHLCYGPDRNSVVEIKNPLPITPFS